MTLARIRIAGAIAAIVTACFILIAGYDRLGQSVFDQWQCISPRDLSNTQVRIVWIDDQSLSEIGPWPWPRRTLAKLIFQIAEQQPRVIGLDMLLPEPDRYSPQAFVASNATELSPALAAQVGGLRDTDEMLAETIGSAPVVVGWAGVDADGSKGRTVPQTEPRFASRLPAGVSDWPRLITNVPAVDFVAQGHGLLNGPPDQDGVVRRVPLAGRVSGADVPGFALELAMQAGGIDQAKMVGEGKALSHIQVGKQTVAVFANGQMAVRLGTLTKTAQVSAFDVLSGDAQPSVFRDAIVIIGVNAAGTADQVSTVLDPDGFGSVVQANAVDTILKGRALSRPVWASIAELLTGIALVAACLALLPRLGGWMAGGVTIGLFGLVLGGSWLAYAQADLLLNPVAAIVASLATGITMVLLLFSEARRQRRELAHRLQEERVTAAQAQGELDAARSIQLGMLPPPERLAKLDPRLDIAGLVEPAKSIGGDFFDCVTVAPGVHAFIVGDVSGKGVGAALFMALSKALTKSVLLRGSAGLAEAVGQINTEVSRDNSEDMFVTLLVAILDAETGRLTLCAAGHEYPWIVRADGSIEMIKPEGGPPVGVAPGFPYGASDMLLGEGDTLVIVSDGITEAKAPNEDYFEHPRLRMILEGWQPELGSGKIVTSLRDAVRIFEADQEATDDLTVLAVRRIG